MDLTFVVGVIGALILVCGAAWPPGKSKVAWKSVKNWLFMFGGLTMLAYSILLYLSGGPIFFLFLQIFVNLTSISMMLDVDDKIDLAVIGTSGLAFVAWSLYLFEGAETVYFVLGLVVLGLGYALKMGTVKRNLALAIGSGWIGFFSYVVSDWIFFWLNVFFAIFSFYYVWKLSRAH
jgi:hypothetical protein